MLPHSFSKGQSSFEYILMAMVAAIMALSVGGAIYTSLQSPVGEISTTPLVGEKKYITIMYVDPSSGLQSTPFTFYCAAKGVDRIDLIVDGRLIHTCNDLPYCQATKSGFSGSYSGTKHSFTCRVGKGGSVLETHTIFFYVYDRDVTPPTVNVSVNPTSGDPSTLFSIVCNASDNIGIKQITLSVDGSIVNTCNTSPCSYQSLFPEGTHNVVCDAVDYGNNFNSSSTTFTVGVVAPPPGGGGTGGTTSPGGGTPGGGTTFTGPSETIQRNGISLSVGYGISNNKLLLFIYAKSLDPNLVVASISADQFPLSNAGLEGTLNIIRYYPSDSRLHIDVPDGATLCPSSYSDILAEKCIRVDTFNQYSTFSTLILEYDLEEFRCRALNNISFTVTAGACLSNGQCANETFTLEWIYEGCQAIPGIRAELIPIPVGSTTPRGWVLTCIAEDRDAGLEWIILDSVYGSKQCSGDEMINWYPPGVPSSDFQLFDFAEKDGDTVVVGYCAIYVDLQDIFNQPITPLEFSCTAKNRWNMKNTFTASFPIDWCEYYSFFPQCQTQQPPSTDVTFTCKYNLWAEVIGVRADTGAEVLIQRCEDPTGSCADCTATFNPSEFTSIRCITPISQTTVSTQQILTNNGTYTANLCCSPSGSFVCVEEGTQNFRYLCSNGNLTDRRAVMCCTDADCPGDNWYPLGLCYEEYRDYYCSYPDFECTYRVVWSRYICYDIGGNPYIYTPPQYWRGGGGGWGSTPFYP